MKSLKDIVPDMKAKISEDIERKFSDKIKKEYPEITKFSVKYNLEKQTISFQGLTPEQEAHILRS